MFALANVYWLCVCVQEKESEVRENEEKIQERSFQLDTIIEKIKFIPNIGQHTVHTVTKQNF